MCFLLLAVGLRLASAQGPGNGVSKTTYAAQMDPLGGMAFVQRYFGTTPSEDSCTASVCQCEAGMSETSSPWYAPLGRSQMILEEKVGYYPGKCVLLTKSADAVAGYGNSTMVAVFPGPGPGDACSYVPGSYLTAAAGDNGYTVNAHSQEGCCKSCAALDTCVGATYVAANFTAEVNYTDMKSDGPGPVHYAGFGLHLPAITAHKTTGGLSVENVERAFDDKMGNMTTFDSFMDFNVGLFTADLDSYVEKFDADAVPYLKANWTTPSGGLWYSVFVHVPSSQMIIELIAASSKLLAGDSALVPLEQRLSDTVINFTLQNPPTGSILQAVKVSRAATDLDALDDFYVAGMRTKLVYSVDDDAVSARCYLWPYAEADVCFVKRPDSATSGLFKVGDFERMLKHVADILSVEPYCNMNRWEDNHYAYDPPNNSSVDLDHIPTYIDENPSVKYSCGGPVGGLHYIFDPTGWAVQIDAFLLPSACNAAPTPDEDPIDPGPTAAFCGGGVCSAGPSPSPPSPQQSPGRSALVAEWGRAGVAIQSRGLAPVAASALGCVAILATVAAAWRVCKMRRQRVDVQEVSGAGDERALLERPRP